MAFHPFPPVDVGPFFIRGKTPTTDAQSLMVIYCHVRRYFGTYASKAHVYGYFLNKHDLKVRVSHATVFFVFIFFFVPLRKIVNVII